jgi:hypothetical protein
MVSAATLPLLTTSEFKEIYASIESHYHDDEYIKACISKCLSEIALLKQEGLRVLLIGPGTGEYDLSFLTSYKIDHLTAVEPSFEMADELEVNLRSSSNFIIKWNIERTTIESYLMNKNHNDGPFDIILMIHSVYYVSPRGDILRQVRSLLQPHIGQFIVVLILGGYITIARKYILESKTCYDADDLEHDLRNVNIPFERHVNNVTLDITGIKGDDRLQWVFASFCLGVNVAYADNNLAAEVTEDLINMANTTNDGKLHIKCREDVFVVRPAD